jgi:hypothetical protein
MPEADRRRGGEEPPLWGWCSYCGGRICLGESYYEDEGLPVCLCCARRCAWMHFLERCVKRPRKRAARYEVGSMNGVERV